MNKIFFIIITLILLSCCNQQVQNEEEERDYPLIDYQRDSVYYLLDVRGDSEKEKLLVTREVMVQDSIFGGGENMHGRYEYVAVESMEKATQVIIEIARLAAL